MSLFHLVLVGLLAGLLVQWLWRRFTIRPPVTRARRFKDAAWSFWITPTIMFSPLIILLSMIGPGEAVRHLVGAWEFYLYFIALPYLAGLLLWLHARRLERSP